MITTKRWNRISNRAYTRAERKYALNNWHKNAITDHVIQNNHNPKVLETESFRQYAGGFSDSVGPSEHESKSGGLPSQRDPQPFVRRKEEVTSQHRKTFIIDHAR